MGVDQGMFSIDSHLDKHRRQVPPTNKTVNKCILAGTSAQGASLSRQMSVLVGVSGRHAEHSTVSDLKELKIPLAGKRNRKKPKLKSTDKH